MQDRISYSVSNMNSDSFGTVEDELNFIFGNGDQWFDIDSALQDAEELAALPPATNDVGQYFLSSATTEADRSAATSMATADGGNKPLVDSQNSIISGTVSISPIFSANEFAPQVLDDFMLDDFSFDLEDDTLHPAPKNFTRSTGPTRQESNRPFAPFDQSQEHERYSPPSPCSIAAFKKKRPACKFSIPPTVHPAYPLRKRKITFSHEVLNPSSTTREEPGGSIQCSDPCTATHIKAMESRQARKRRRLLRAKSQVINLMGGGDILQIQRYAVLDSDYTFSVGPAEQALLSDVARNFSPKEFIDMTFEHVYQTLVETSKAEETASVQAASKLAAMNHWPPSPTPMKSASNSDITPPAATSNQHTLQESAAVATSLTKDNLPMGKDPESRRLRRLMRNRLSAQASRDRRKKAIEFVQQQKAAKEEEIVLLKKTLSKQIQRMMLLEKATMVARKLTTPI